MAVLLLLAPALNSLRGSRLVPAAGAATCCQSRYPGAARVHNKAGATELVTLRTSPNDFTQLDEEAVRYSLPGKYTFSFGGKDTAPHGAQSDITMKTDDEDDGVHTVHGFGVGRAEVLAAKEMRRYWGLLSGSRPLLATASLNGSAAKLLLQHMAQDQGSALVVVATRDHQVLQTAMRGIEPGFDAALDALNTSDSHIVHRLQSSQWPRPVVICSGVTPQATLYAVYSFVEHLGARFFLHGDVLPEPNPALAIPTALSITFTPKFSIRGLQPFHDFPMGPSRAKSASRSLRRALLMPQVNPGSLYRCG